jgi:hypothetical protein
MCLSYHVLGRCRRDCPPNLDHNRHTHTQNTQLMDRLNIDVHTGAPRSTASITTEATGTTKSTSTARQA